MPSRSPGRASPADIRLLPALIAAALLCCAAGASRAEDRPLGAGGRAPSPTDGDSAAAEVLLVRVKEAWNARGSLVATIEQTQEFAGFDEPLVSRGKLRILKPSYFDLRFDPPHRQRQVCDGKHVWTYMEDQKQAFRTPLSPDARLGADLFNWALVGARGRSARSDTSMGEGILRLELAPGANLSLAELRVWLREATAELIACEVIDAEGNRTRVRILSLRDDPGLGPDDFRFAPPEGTEVIDAGGGG